MLEDKQKDLLILKKNIPKAIRNEYILTLEELKESKDIIKAEVNELLTQINTVDENLKQSKIALDEYSKLDENIVSFVDRYNKADFLTKKGMLNEIIEKVVIYRDSVEIEYKVTINVFKENSVDNTGCEIDSNGLPSELHPNIFCTTNSYIF
ncbi:MAG TPA: hypothetical protein PK733_15900 [Clostridiales bacterium]|nr:hypothetical protein [Clostridiales bacterium]